ncbi:adenylate cyclase type 10-like [Centruroides vittatus]|uniref:adenylate cyclase type 10-like n=1 Tax=Centruroides vittatus TaxID=120091 RepID=UPI00350F360D
MESCFEIKEENLPECLRRAVFWVRSTKDEENERRLEAIKRRRILKDIDELKLKGSWEFTQKDNPIASFVPDIVIKYIQQERFIKLPFRTKFYGIALFADISGFTSLTEKYTQIGTTGIEELTETLNNYIGPVVARIIAAKGDVFKFAGL